MNFYLLEGKTITSIEGAEADQRSITIRTAEGYRFEFLHYQDCCEYVSVNNVHGDPLSLIGKKVVAVTEDISHSNFDDYESSTTTIFTILAEDSEGNKEYVVIEWLGVSNGYYGEGVDVIVEEP